VYYTDDYNIILEKNLMTKRIAKKSHRQSPEEIKLIKMMDAMASGQHDTMWAITIRRAIQNGANINVVDKNGESPLVLAIKMHNYFIVK
jgi:ankyrin repeat protein